jgi:hypothetical protein
MRFQDITDTKDLIQVLLGVLKDKLPDHSTGYANGFPREFEGDGRFMPFEYVGHVTDMSIGQPTLPGVYPTINEIKMAAEFWYNDKRLSCQPDPLLPTFRVHPVSPSGLERGGFHHSSFANCWTNIPMTSSNVFVENAG